MVSVVPGAAGRFRERDAAHHRYSAVGGVLRRPGLSLLSRVVLGVSVSFAAVAAGKQFIALSRSTTFATCRPGSG